MEMPGARTSLYLPVHSVHHGPRVQDAAGVAGIVPPPGHSPILNPGGSAPPSVASPVTPATGYPPGDPPAVVPAWHNLPKWVEAHLYSQQVPDEGPPASGSEAPADEAVGAVDADEDDTSGSDDTPGTPPGEDDAGGA